MRQEEFPNCCGIMTISDFGYTNTTGGNYGAVGTKNDIFSRQPPPSKEQIKEYIQSCLNDFKDYALLLISFNEEQKTELGSIVEELGFKLVSEGLNSHHNSKVYLYSFANTEYYSYDDYDDYYEDEEEF